MNILITIYFPPNFGGAEISTFTLAKELKKQGHNVIMASTAPYPDIKTYTFKKYQNIPLFSIQRKYLSKFLTKIIKKENIDIVHSSDRLTTPGAVIAAKKNNVPVVNHFRDYWFACPKSNCLLPDNTIYDVCTLKHVIKGSSFLRFPWNLYKYLDLKKIRPLLETADYKIANSDAVKRKLKLNNIKTNVETVPITRDISSFLKEKGNLKKEYKLKGTVITFIGALIESKGILLMLDIMPEILKKHNAQFLIVGKGPLDQEIATRIKSLNMQDQIIQTGKLSRKAIPKIYNSSDIILLPSLWEEPFSGILLESMAAKLPVIGSNLGGTPDGIENKKTGFIVSPLDKKAWKNKIELLIKNKALRKKMGTAANHYLKTKYNVPKIVKHIIKIYKNVKS